jgi:transposase
MGQHRKVVLPEDHRTQLEHLIRAGKANASVHTRARILVLTDYSQAQHRTDADIAASLQIPHSTVVRVRKRYLDAGLAAVLKDKPRPGQPPKITGAVEAQLTVLACSAPPDGYAHWTLRLLADRLVELGHVDSISPTAVGNRLKKTH